jgi:hypothetical protein
MFFGYELLQGDGQVFAEDKDKSNYPVAAVLHRAQQREMHAGDIGRERRTRGKDGSGFAEWQAKSGLNL